jgi:hypothetical protein
MVPHTPRPPFRLYAGEGHEPLVVPDVATIVASASRRGDVELTYLVPGKARPVLILSDPPADYHEDVTALRLLRLSRVEARDRERVRAQGEPLLFHLDPGRFQLPEENAAMVSALVRIHVEAIDSGDSLGELDPNERRALGEAIINFYRFDTRNLVERQIRALAARHRGT